MKMIPLAKPLIEEEDIDQVVSVLKSGWLSMGPKTKEFEKEFAKTIGTKHAISVNSGTSGLHLIIKALGIKEGDEVITTPFSFIASSNCILYENAKPVFVDVDEDTFNINPNLIESKITDKTKAILVVHVFGQSCDMDKIISIAKKYNLYVIEDACESILAKYKGKNTGTFGDAGVFAFYPNKQITTGEGGMVVTNNDKISMLCDSMKNQGRGNDVQWLYHERLGYNYRMDEMSSALGLSQTKRIHKVIKKRQELANYYINELKDIKGIQLPYIDKNNEHTWFVFPIRVNYNIRNGLIKKLNEEGIQSKAYFDPSIHLQPFYKDLFGYKEGDFPVSEKLSKEIIILPFFTSMSIDNIKKVKLALSKVVGEKNEVNI